LELCNAVQAMAGGSAAAIPARGSPDLAGEEAIGVGELTSDRFVAGDEAERSPASRPGGAVAQRPLELRSSEGGGTSSATNGTGRSCGAVWSS
jgi:hypothetical protein